MDSSYTKELNSGYINENGAIKIDFIDGFPQKLADEFNKTEPKLSVSQSRAIFDSVNGFYGNYTRKSISFDEVKIELSMLKSRINDKVNKGSIPQEFLDFFDKNINAVKTPDDFRAFKYHFEAVCNYLKDDKKDKNQGNNNGGYNRGGNGNGGNYGGYNRNGNNGGYNRNGNNNYRR